MAAKKSSRHFILCIFGAAYSARSICSTSIIPDTIAIEVRCWFRRFVYTSISEKLISEFTRQNGRLLPDADGYNPHLSMWRNRFMRRNFLFLARLLLLAGV